MSEPSSDFVTVSCAGNGYAVLNTPHVATLPDGTRVNLPAGTTLGEGEVPAMPKGGGLDVCERLGRQLALVAAAPDVEMGPSARKAVGEASKVLASLAQIVRLPSGDALAGKAPEAPEAPERTPETVLRAMLLAYERAALEAEEAYYRAGRNDEDRSLEASDAADAAVGIVRSALAKLAVYGDAGFDDDGPRIAADYAARLAGTTPLDAPPAP